MNGTVGLALAMVYLGLCVALGGGTRQGLPADGVLQLLALPVLALVLLSLPWAALNRYSRWALLWVLAVLAWLGLQLVPLPPGLWSKLAGRAELMQELALVGLQDRWRPISLDWQASLRALLAWLPPFALGFLSLGLSQRRRVALLRVALALAVASAVLGLIQLSGGPDSLLRWHEISNDTSAVGPFANRNHLATLLACALPLAFAGLLTSAHSHSERSRIVRRTLATLALVILVIGLTMTRSRAGVAMGCLALLGIGAMLWRWRQYRQSEGHAGSSTRGWLLLVAGISLMLVIQYALVALIQRFELDPLDDERVVIAGVTLEAIDRYGMLGTGAGTFVPVYASTEPPSLRKSRFVNRAHNDWLEWVLEGGWPLLGLLAMGLGLLLAATIRWWRRTGPAAVWGQASSIALWTILIHGFFDYPLRTISMTAFASVLAACLFADLSTRRMPIAHTSDGSP